MKILFINNDGGGFADHVEVEEGVTIEQLFSKQMGAASSPGNFLIRINRQPVSANQVLHDGDRVSITPTKIEGARSS